MQPDEHRPASGCAVAAPTHSVVVLYDGRVDVHGQDRHAVALRVVDEDLDRVEAHRLGVDEPDQELGRVEQLEERRFVGGPGERRGVALGEPERRERGDLAEQLLGVVARSCRAGAVQPSTNCAWSFSISRLERHVPIARRNPSDSAGVKPGDLDGDPHDLLLVEDHAERVLEDRLEARVEVGRPARGPACGAGTGGRRCPGSGPAG